MDVENKALLNDVIKDRLDRALIADPKNEDDRQIFKEAMEAINKQIELDKVETSHEEQVKRLEMEIEKLKVENDKHLRDEAAKKSEARKDRLVQVGLFVGGLVLGESFDYIKKMKFARHICEFEKDYNFTTSAGKGVSGIFRFKK